ncbi:MAG: hypothetical protein JWM63_1650 [Gammaproteobacteria bacterium]|jgi:hypothetical protein|nr:hypothetical protein [Gammaproteobacteria bacterium]
MAIWKGRYSRKLSPIERASLVLNEFCNYNCDIIVQGYGALSVETLRTAVEKAAQANPGSRVRLRGILGFSRWVDSGIAPEVQEVHASVWDGHSERGAAFMQERFDALAGGPICKVLYVRGSPAHIVFRALHAAVDGRSILHWMAEVFRALRGEPLLGSPCTYIDWDIMRKFQEKVNRSALDGPSTEPNLPVIPCSSPREARLRYIWRAVVFPKIIPNVLPKFAIFLAEYARRNAQGRVCFTVPVDLRTLREEVLSLGNLTGYLSIPIEPGDTTRSFSRQLSLRVRNYAECHRPDILKKLPWVPVRTIRRAIARNMQRALYEPAADAMSGGVVSMGNFPLQNVSAPAFTALELIPIPGFAGKLNVVTIFTERHTITSFAAPESYNGDGQLDGLLDDFQREFGEQRTPNTAVAV